MHTKLYKSCPKKLQARQLTIIEPYRQLFHQRLPTNKQYWSLCSQQVNDNGSLLPDSELDQLLKSNLISQNQFHGVDREQHVIDLNQKYLPNCHWYNNDLYRAMCIKNLNPGIINIDTIEMPATGIILVAKIMDLLNHANIHEVLLTANFVLQTRHHKIQTDAINKAINSNMKFLQCFVAGNWQITSSKDYKYPGTGNSKTIMGSIILHRL